MKLKELLFAGFTFLIVALAGLVVSSYSAEITKKTDENIEWKSASSVYNFHANNIDENDVDLASYKGNVLIVVNVASNCGLTDANYKQLQSLYEKYSSEGLRILAFPCNQFNEQEPGTAEEIKEFVKRYGVTFDMFKKIEVNGENAHPFYKWLKAQPNPAGNFTQDIKWNFTKFVISRDGNVVARFTPKTEPNQMEETLLIYLNKLAQES